LNRLPRVEYAARRTRRGEPRSSSVIAVSESSQNSARFGRLARIGEEPYEGRRSAKAEKPIGSRVTL
jgi:hypothetical protein